MYLSELEDFTKEVMRGHEDLFILKQDISKKNDIKVVIDGDNPINIEDCRKINKALEKKLEENGMDASVQVTSPGVDEPLKMRRQFYKNIGRKLAVKTDELEIKANLESVDEDHIVLTWKAREKKEKGKGKVTKEKRETIAFEKIEKAVVMINFNKK